MKDTHARGKKSRGGKLSHNFGAPIMKKLMLFLLLFGLASQVRADGRVAVTGVPVVGGYQTLYTTPPNEESQYDDYGRPARVPYSQTHYARNLPGNLTLGQGRIKGKPWYFNSAGYNSYHYGEHYQPTGGLTESYSGYTNSCGNSYSGNYSGGNLRELWIPIDRPREPKMSVVTSPLPKYSGWYINTPGFAGWLPGYVGPYGPYYDYLASQQVWGQYRGHVYDKRLYREPAGGWEKPKEGATPVTTRAGPDLLRSIPEPMPIMAPMESRTEVGYYTVQENGWKDDGTSFVDGNKTSWKLATGDAVHESLRSYKVKGYLVTVTHLDGTEKVYLHFVEWVDKKWRPTGQIWE